MNREELRKVSTQALESWKKLRLHLGLLTKFPYSQFLPDEVVTLLRQWRDHWEELDAEVVKKWRSVSSAGKKL